MEFADLPADFNSGLAIVFILDSIKKGLINARLKNNFEERYKMLVCYWMELSSLVTKPAQKEKNAELWKKVKEALKNINAAIVKKDKAIPTAWIDAFDEWEEFLRQTQQDVGVGMPRSDPRFVMGK